MVLDSSAVVAILRREPEAVAFAHLVASANLPIMSAASVLETATLLEGRYGESAGRELDLFLVEANIRVVSVDREQVEAARRGWRKYGKGRHPAALNFGDCFSYALAKISGEPLLAKGKDFAQTDIPMCQS
jgi:ribonuclease VapC